MIKALDPFQVFEQEQELSDLARDHKRKKETNLTRAIGYIPTGAIGLGIAVTQGPKEHQYALRADPPFMNPTLYGTACIVLGAWCAYMAGRGLYSVYAFFRHQGAENKALARAHELRERLAMTAAPDRA
jgi:hypothetical protein